MTTREDINAILQRGTTARPRRQARIDERQATKATFRTQLGDFAKKRTERREERIEDKERNKLRRRIIWTSIGLSVPLVVVTYFIRTIKKKK